jgi:hypothetical protein
MTMKFTRVTPGEYIGTDGTHTARIHRTREGSLYAHEVMWVAEVNGHHITNVNTLADAKAAVTEHLTEVYSR